MPFDKLYVNFENLSSLIIYFIEDKQLKELFKFILKKVLALSSLAQIWKSIELEQGPILGLDVQGPNLGCGMEDLTWGVRVLFFWYAIAMQFCQFRINSEYNSILWFLNIHNNRFRNTVCEDLHQVCYWKQLSFPIGPITLQRFWSFSDIFW